MYQRNIDEGRPNDAIPNNNQLLVNNADRNDPVQNQNVVRGYQVPINNQNMNPRAVNYNQVPMVPVINQNAQVINGQMMNQQIRNGQIMNQQIGNDQIRNNQQNVRNNLNNIYKIASIDKNRQDEE